VTKKSIRIGDIFNDIPISIFQYRICTLCFLICFLDGFDLTIISVTLPKIADQLGSSASALGIALGAGQFGPLVGAIVLGTLSDRLGRKWMLFFCTLLFGFFTLITITITNPEQLGIYRFLAGIGLGGAIPNALAISSEYAPKRARAFIVATMYAGMPTGAMAGGLLAAYFIPHFGWQSLFMIGGWAPFALGLLIAFLLPESIEFLASRNRQKDKAKVLHIFRKITGEQADDESIEILNTEKSAPGAPIKRLFTEGRAITTLLLWAICSGALYLLWVINTWAPTLLKNTGASVQQYSIAFAFLSLGAIISSLLIGRTIDRHNPFRVLQFGFVLAAGSLVTFGLGAETGSFTLIAVLSVVCGIFIYGSQTGTLTVAALSYPADIRGTAIGWTYAVAKTGAMLAPVLGGYLLDLHWSISKICSANAVVGVLTAGALIFLQKNVMRKKLSGDETGEVAVTAQESISS